MCGAPNRRAKIWTDAGWCCNFTVMKQIVLAIVLAFFTLSSVWAQRKPIEYTIEIKPINGTGFKGTVDFQFAFTDCFGEVQMLFSYKNVQIESFYYKYRRYTTERLNIASFDDYLLQPDIYLSGIFEPEYAENGRPVYGGVEGGVQKTHAYQMKLNAILNTKIAGCYGQTYKLGTTQDINYKYLYVPIDEDNFAYFNWNPLLEKRVECARYPRRCSGNEGVINANISNASDRYMIKVFNTFSYNHPQFSNLPTQEATVSAVFEVYCNPSNVMTQVYDYAKKLFTTIKKVKINSSAACTNCKPFMVDYAFQGTIEIESVQKFNEATKYAFESNLNTSSIVNGQNFLNARLPNGLYYEVDGNFIYPNTPVDCDQDSSSKRP